MDLKQYHFYINVEQLDFLSNLPGTTSEHIRRAIDEYMVKIKKEQLQVSTSPSDDRKEKKGM